LKIGLELKSFEMKLKPCNIVRIEHFGYNDGENLGARLCTAVGGLGELK
jgi:hypothetical protein